MSISITVVYYTTDAKQNPKCRVDNSEILFPEAMTLFLQGPTLFLLALDGLEQRLEVALAKRLGSFTLDDLVKHRRPVRNRKRKDLKHVTFVVLVHKNSEFPENGDVFVDLADAVQEGVVVGRRNGQESAVVGAECLDGLDNVVRLQGDVLNSRASV